MDRELFERMQAAAARFRAGDSDYEEIMTPAGPAVLVRDRNDPRGFRIDFMGDGAGHVVPVQEYPAAGSRPPGYPAPLPFLQGCRAIVNTLDQSVSWPEVADVEAAAERLAEQSVDDGWTRVERLPSTSDQGKLLWAITKEGIERTLVLDGEGEEPRLVLQERRPTE
jgi:hypothetical protein